MCTTARTRRITYAVVVSSTLQSANMTLYLLKCMTAMYALRQGLLYVEPIDQRLQWQGKP